MQSESEIKKQNSYFPFETCEKPTQNEWMISQPYSTAINALNSLIIFFFLLQTKTTYTFIFLFILLLFELIHTLSHSFHINGPLQTNIIHGFAYAINAALLYALYRHSNIFPSRWFILILFIWIGLDIYALFTLSTVFYILSQFVIFLSILFFYYSSLPVKTKNSIPWILMIGILIVCLVYNEMRNCDEMAKLYPTAPFHILVEIPGVFFFYFICRNFYDL